MGFVVDKKNKRIMARRVGRGSIPSQFIWDLWWIKRIKELWQEELVVVRTQARLYGICGGQKE
jgi:hypothetical protein